MGAEKKRFQQQEFASARQHTTLHVKVLLCTLLAAWDKTKLFQTFLTTEMFDCDYCGTLEYRADYCVSW